jgi:hypothetical protein
MFGEHCTDSYCIVCYKKVKKESYPYSSNNLGILDELLNSGIMSHLKHAASIPFGSTTTKMEDTIHFYYVFVALALVSLLRVFARCRRSAAHGLRLAPGPWQLPVIGSLHHLVGSGRTSSTVLYATWPSATGR